MPVDAFDSFLASHLRRIEPLKRAVNEAYWRSSISGSKEDSNRFAALRLELQECYRDRTAFERIGEWKKSDAMSDPLVRRQLQLLYVEYERNQIDPGLAKSLVELSTEIENSFNVYRGRINGREISNNGIAEILKESNDTALRKAAWETSKHVGTLIADKLLELVALRNRAARSLGYGDYYAMSLELNEQNESSLVRIFDHLEQLTAEPFRNMKAEIDSALASRFGIPETALRPWHYEDPFFQRAPGITNMDLDAYYRDLDITDLVSGFFSGIGLEVTDIIERSDLFEKPGKEQHAYCIDIDRAGDIRILANIRSDESWAGTMLHELGHAVYDKYIDRKLPFLLRRAAHIFTTEAVAMLFGRLSKNARWIQLATGISDEERRSIDTEVSKQLRFSQLVFVRWCQVMFHFERTLYRDPGTDLNECWWELVNRYQFLHVPGRRGRADWAAKIHIASVPVYYHNYLLGELLASQLDGRLRRIAAMRSRPGGIYNGVPAVGEFLRERVFAPGALYRWDELIERATDEPLTPRYFIEQFV